MQAFDLCVERGIPAVELDIHLCKSGELVIIHDHELQRLAATAATVEDLTYEELRKLDVGTHKDAAFAGSRIPLLDELFERHGKRLYYDVELKVRGTKDTGIGAKAWETIRSHGLQSVCMVSSFNPFAIRHFNAASGRSIPTAVIYCEDDEVPRILQHGWGRHIANATVLKPRWNQVDRSMLQRFRMRKGYPVITWTVDDPEIGSHLIGLGVDGIISNNPAQFVAQR